MKEKKNGKTYKTKSKYTKKKVEKAEHVKFGRGLLGDIGEVDYLSTTEASHGSAVCIVEKELGDAEGATTITSWLRLPRAFCSALVSVL